MFHVKVPTRSPAPHAELVQRRGQPADAGGDVGEAGAAHARLGERHDLAVGVRGAAVAKDAGDGQRKWLHGALHRAPPAASS